MFNTYNSVPLDEKNLFFPSPLLGGVTILHFSSESRVSFSPLIDDIFPRYSLLLLLFKILLLSNASNCEFTSSFTLSFPYLNFALSIDLINHNNPD